MKAGFRVCLPHRISAFFVLNFWQLCAHSVICFKRFFKVFIQLYYFSIEEMFRVMTAVPWTLQGIPFCLLSQHSTEAAFIKESTPSIFPSPKEMSSDPVSSNGHSFSFPETISSYGHSLCSLPTGHISYLDSFTSIQLWSRTFFSLFTVLSLRIFFGSMDLDAIFMLMTL